MRARKKIQPKNKSAKSYQLVVRHFSMNHLKWTYSFIDWRLIAKHNQIAKLHNCSSDAQQQNLHL